MVWQEGAGAALRGGPKHAKRHPTAQGVRKAGRMSERGTSQLCPNTVT